MRLSGRAEHQSGSKRTGASLSLSLSLPPFSLSLSLSSSPFLSVSVSLSPSPCPSYRVSYRPVSSDHFSRLHASRGEAEKQSSMAGREPAAYYATERYHGAQSSAIKPPGSVGLPGASSSSTLPASLLFFFFFFFVFFSSFLVFLVFFSPITVITAIDG